MKLTDKLRELVETADATNKGREPLVSLLICVRLLDVQSMIDEAERLESQNRRLRELVRSAWDEGFEVGDVGDPTQHEKDIHWAMSKVKAALDKEGSDA